MARPTPRRSTSSCNSPTRSRIAFAHALPQLDDARLEVKVVEVTYGPGESSTPHRHACAVIGYVLEGAVRMQMMGEPQATYKQGDSFYEAPNGIHLVSANASDKSAQGSSRTSSATIRHHCRWRCLTPVSDNNRETNRANERKLVAD